MTSNIPVGSGKSGLPGGQLVNSLMLEALLAEVIFGQWPEASGWMRVSENPMADLFYLAATDDRFKVRGLSLGAGNWPVFEKRTGAGALATFTGVAPVQAKGLLYDGAQSTPQQLMAWWRTRDLRLLGGRRGVIPEEVWQEGYPLQMEQIEDMLQR